MEEKKSNGALIGIIVIIILLLLGGIYVWQMNKNKILKNPQPLATTSEDSAALDTLDQDLQSVDTNVDVNLDEVE